MSCVEPPSSDRAHYVFRLSHPSVTFLWTWYLRSSFRAQMSTWTSRMNWLDFVRHRSKVAVTSQNIIVTINQEFVYPQMSYIQEVKGQTSMTLHNVLQNKFWPFYGPDSRHGGDLLLLFAATGSKVRTGNNSFYTHHKDLNTTCYREFYVARFGSSISISSQLDLGFRPGGLVLCTVPVRLWPEGTAALQPWQKNITTDCWVGKFPISV